MINTHVLVGLLLFSPAPVDENTQTVPTTAARTAGPESANVFRDSNLVAWCIVPFDAKQRGPAARAEMLKELGIRKVAYDWRARHVPEFEAEIREYKKHGLEYFAFWSEHDTAFELFRKYKLHPQIWRTAPSPQADSREERIAAAGRELQPFLKKANAIGCRFGLYNHGGWGGEPANLVAVCKWLRENVDGAKVGIVYNLHHGHSHIDDFADSLRLMKPYLMCLNINGMNDNAQPKILAVGRGKHDARLMKTIHQSGYNGPIGILDHRPEMDARESLRENLDGVRRMRKALLRSTKEADHEQP